MNKQNISTHIFNKICNFNFLEMEDFIIAFTVNPKDQCLKYGVLVETTLSNSDVNEIVTDIVKSYKKIVPNFSLGDGYAFSGELGIKNQYIRDFVYIKIMEFYDKSSPITNIYKTLYNTDIEDSEKKQALSAIGFSTEMCEYLFSTIDVQNISMLLFSVTKDKEEKQKILIQEYKDRKEKIKILQKKEVTDSKRNSARFTNDSVKKAMNKTLSIGEPLIPIIEKYSETYDTTKKALAKLGFSNDELLAVMFNAPEILNMLEQRKRLNL